VGAVRKLLFSALLLTLSAICVQAQYVDRTKVSEAVPVTATLQSAATANGDGATLDVSGYSSVTFTITGTFTATVNFEATGDDTNWVALQVVQIGTTTIVTTSTSPGTFSASIGSLKSVRARVSGYSSGSVTVLARASLAQGSNPQVIAGKVGVNDASGNGITSTSNALDINIKSGNPSTITVTQGTATSLKAQAESYQGGSAVSSSNPLQVTLANTGANATAVKVDNSAVTQPISAASLPLPTNAATSTKQSDGSQKTQVVDGSGNVIGATSNALDINIKSGNPTSITANAGTNLNTSALALSATQTDGSQKTRITDGTNDAAVKAASTAAVAADKALVVAVSPNNTVPISVASLPLPSTAATSTKQSDGSQKTQVVDGSGNVIGSTGNALDINIKSGNPTTVQPIAGTTNGTSTCVVQSAASTNATNCKNAAGLLYGIEIVNTTSTLYYLRLYNLSSSPTCSSATGFIRTVPIPHASGAGAGIANFYTVGETYGTGIGFCLTGGGSSTDNSNAATGVYVTLHYK
jgi:hypothetical protein